MKKATRSRRMQLYHLRQRFKRHLLKKMKEACTLSEDSLGGICDLVDHLGADEVIHLLVVPDEIHNPPSGFIRLMNSNLARLTIEQAILDFAETGLFTKLQIETARERLAVYARMGQRFK